MFHAKRQHRHDHQGQGHGWQLAEAAGYDQVDQGGHGAECQGEVLGVRQMPPGLDHCPEKGAGVRDRVPERLADLVGDDQQRRAADITGHDRSRDVLDQVGDFQERPEDQEHADQEQQQRQHRQFLLRITAQPEREKRAHDHHRGRVGRTEDDKARPGKQRRQDRRHGRPENAVPDGQPGNRRIRHPLGKRQQGHIQARLQIFLEPGRVVPAQ